MITNKHKETCSCGKKYWVWTVINKKRKNHRVIGYPEKSCHCNCGAKWGEHWKEIKVEDFIPYVKDKCFWCGNSIDGTFEYYLDNGNSCHNCSAKAEKSLKKIWKNKLKNKNVAEATRQ